jgi:amino acid transporter
MGYARLYYATGRDGVWPGPVNRLLAHIHPLTQSPVRATLILCLCAAAMMLLGEQLLLVFCSSENIFEYLLMAAAVLVGRRLGTCGLGFRAPLHPFIPLFALAVTAGLVVAEWMDPAAGRPSLILISGLFVASLVYYRFRMARGSGGWATVPGEVVDLT